MLFKNILSSLVLLLLLVIQTPLNAQLIISEVMANNYNTIYDADHNSGDWIELKNCGEALSLSGYKIFDKDEIEKAWILPDTILQKGERLLIYADNRDKINNHYLVKYEGCARIPVTHDDTLVYDYIKHSGDFIMTMHVRSISNDNSNFRTGLMIREKDTDDSKFVACYALSHHKDRTQNIFRDEDWGYPSYFNFVQEPLYPEARLVIEKIGDTVYTKVGGNDYYFTEYKANYFPYNNFLLGMVVFGFNKGEMGRVVIDNISLDGERVEFSDLTKQSYNIDTEIYRAYTKEYHANFKLSTDGDEIFLWDPDGNLVDNLSYDFMRANISAGRENKNDPVVFYKKATPELENSEETFLGVLKKPIFNIQGGVYSSNESLLLSHDADDVEIRYTLNGHTPDQNSNLFTGSEIIINKSIPLQARAFKEGYIESSIERKTYIYNEDDKLPIISISADSNALFLPGHGMVHDSNRYAPSEIPVTFEYYKANQNDSYFSADCGMKLHGKGAARDFPQTSLRLHSKSLYDIKNFEKAFFDDKQQIVYDELLFRNSSQDWPHTYMRDALASSIVSEINGLDYASFKLSRLFMNTKYWGMIYMRERYDDEHLALKYNIDLEDLDMVSDGFFGYQVRRGAHGEYKDLLDTLINANLNEDEVYALLDSKIDLVNFIDFMGSQIFMMNTDWPHNNLRFWKSEALDNKWRWVIYDLDWAFASPTANLTYHFDFTYQHLFAQAKDGRAEFHLSVLFKKMLENEKFKRQYVNRYCDLLNTVFITQKLLDKIDDVSITIVNELNRHRERWPESCIDWSNKHAVIKNFVQNRPGYAFKEIENRLDAGKEAYMKFRINNPGQGFVKLNSLTLLDKEWNGKYFTEVPIFLEAVAKPGYEFDHWSFNNSKDSKIQINPEDGMTIEAFFKKTSTAKDLVVINEIMYKSSNEKDCGDWIELYNPGSSDIDLSSWIIKDDDDAHFAEIPNNTIIKSNSYIVLCSDLEKFNTIYPNVSNVIECFSFGFGKEDAVRIYDKNNVLFDEVNYTYQYPWDPGAYGTGYSLELINPIEDNDIAKNWQSSYIEMGTPGEKNSRNNDSSENEIVLDEYSVNPSPAENYIVITITEDDLNQEAEIIDINGKSVRKFKLNNINNMLQISDISKGVYFIRINHINKYLKFVKK